MYKVMCMIIFFAFSVLAGDLISTSKRQEVVILDDREYGIESSQDIRVLSKFFDIKFVIAPSPRHWQLISKNDNYCLTTRIKSAQRKSVAFFSLYPTSYDYPHILIINM